ncbi:MAG: tetratricopeptide repeat protein [Kiritimatiellae bacterium]|nr:tetratricopeptide repeat protein [Kiritimatiellia bacterium]
MRLQSKGIGAWAAVAAALVLAAAAPAQEPAGDAFLRDLTEAYVTFGRANRAREEGAWTEALSLYEDAHAQYRRLHNLYPDRQADIVQYRMADCANRIEELRRRAGAEKKPESPRAGPRAGPPAEPLADLRAENEKLRERLSAVETNAALAAVVSSQEIERLTRDLADARARAADTNQAARIAESARQLEKMRGEKEDLKAAHRELDRKIQALTNELETARARLEAEKTADEAALSEARRAGEEQAQLREQAERHLAEALRAGEAARAQLAQKEKDLEALQASQAGRQDKIEALEEKVRKAAETRKKQAAELDERTAQLAAEQEQAASLRADLEKARRDAEAAAGETGRLKAALEAAEARVGELERAFAKSREADGPAAADAVALEKEGRLEEALAAYRSAGDRPEAVEGAGRCLLKLGRTGEGVAILEGAVAREPGDPEARLLLGIGLCTLRRYGEASDTLGAAVPLDPSNAALRNALGVAWIGQGRLAEARAELEQAVSLNADLGDAHLNLALILAAGLNPDRDAARRHYERALELGVAPEPHLEKTLGSP